MTIRRTYELRDLGDALFEQVADTIRFSYPQSFQQLDAKTIAVEFDTEAATRFVDDFVQHAKSTGRKLRDKVLFEHRASRLHPASIDQDLADGSYLDEVGNGLVGFRGVVLDVFEFFQAEFRSLARRYNAEEQRYPVMMPIEVLEEIGYFTHFPQHVTFCSHFPEDLAFLESVAEAAKSHDGCLPEAIREGLRAVRHVLQPAVCLPCYPRMRNRMVDPDGSERVSIENHVFRYEGTNCRSLARCWEFTVRDVVFFGSTAAVGRLRQELMEWAFALCRELDLDARVQLANDPFFLNEARNKRVYQRLGEVKYELVLSLPHRDEAIAAASFNLHRDFYSQIYNIRLPDGGPAESGCVGFGIERWVYGFLSQKGLEPGRWPERLARYVAQRSGRTADATAATGQRPEAIEP